MNSYSLKDRNILITGGAVRIGAAIADALAADGARPIIHFNQSKTAAQKLARDLQRKHKVAAKAIDSALDTETQCRDLIRRATSAADGRLDGLINNAAVFHKDSLLAATQEKLDSEFQTNLIAPIHLTRAFAATASSGCIINMLDRRVASNETGCIPYLLSKKALADFTRLAALELAPAFRVNAVAPGAILPPPGQPESRLRDLAGHVPLDLQVTPRNVAEAVIYLLKAESVTGQIIFVDGGQHLLGNF